ncbi:serine/threonine-protein kinase MST20-like protein, partial [Tanacetum coccineum]
IIKNSDFDKLRELGHGTFGTVYHEKWRGKDVAIKRINEHVLQGKRQNNNTWVDLCTEAIKLAYLHHPNFVAFYGVVLDGLGGSVAMVT